MHFFRIFEFFRLSLLTNPHFYATILSVKNLAELCNGSTADSDSVRLGSNPGSAAIKKKSANRCSFFFMFKEPGFEGERY